MKAMTDTETCLDFLFMQFDHVIMERVYLTAAARDAFTLMEISLCDDYRFTVPSVDQLLKNLVYPENDEHEVIGFVSYSKQLTDTFLQAVAAMVSAGEQSMSLLEFLRVFVSASDANHLLTIEQEQDGWFLTGSPEFERQYRTAMRFRIPEAA
ncbi:hypothetical protein [Mesorhizobium sp. M7A.F.Ca.MR.362.00.0.0]|uniref:hypothetical protein n=1 Tax=Mesorhizobium sp. M7A.F.Ca.MR.362.00.0.0 TaxID=2496779 RepID=UPI000FD347D8|nr:hypothetical protein [Mesorhizobium sp. M7A.F.Ca.MR.362.00.0.0]RUU82730.1 hypothetical protein EOC06_02765 [Mesorhizobium sp. M7A.F.Ca.MR.362.00.0.0]RWN96557.1 MAG: hypothetical protein EOS05_01030 [Mesorhizobium sp.]